MSQVAAIPDHLVAILPPAPTKATTPEITSSEQEELLEIREALAALHYAAFAAMYGPPPQDVAVRRVDYGQAERAAPTFLATTHIQAGAKALEWLAAFRSGLDTWMEAGFTDPVVRGAALEPSQPGQWRWGIGDYDEVVLDAASRLARAGRLRELRNLAAFRGDRLPERLDPDAAGFAYGHCTPRPI